MAQASVYNLEGKEIGKMDLSADVFGVKVKKNLVHDVYTALRANARQPWADTKNRGEVRGGGKKPWKQKGTGRARHGSIRSPIWKGGGVTFGPISARSYQEKINKKTNQLAVRMSLSDKVKSSKLLVVEAMSEDGKTKTAATLRKNLPGSGKSTLIVIDKTMPMIWRATRNLPRVDLVRASDVNVVDLMHHDYVIASKAAVSALEKRLA